MDESLDEHGVADVGRVDVRDTPAVAEDLDGAMQPGQAKGARDSRQAAPAELI
jgi:hypothetical protein